MCALRRCDVRVRAIHQIFKEVVECHGAAHVENLGFFGICCKYSRFVDALATRASTGIRHILGV